MAETVLTVVVVVLLLLIVVRRRLSSGRSAAIGHTLLHFQRLVEYVYAVEELDGIVA